MMNSQSSNLFSVLSDTFETVVETVVETIVDTSVQVAETLAEAAKSTAAAASEITANLMEIVAPIIVEPVAAMGVSLASASRSFFLLLGWMSNSVYQHSCSLFLCRERNEETVEDAAAIKIQALLRGSILKLKYNRARSARFGAKARLRQFVAWTRYQSVRSSIII